MRVCVCVFGEGVWGGGGGKRGVSSQGIYMCYYFMHLFILNMDFV